MKYCGIDPVGSLSGSELECRRCKSKFGTTISARRPNDSIHQKSYFIWPNQMVLADAVVQRDEFRIFRLSYS